MTERRLEIGPGARPHQRLAGWETVGLGASCDHRCEWGVDRLPYDDGTFAEVYSSHCLEHVPWFRSVAALREAHRVLVKGGAVEIWVPDFAYVVAAYENGVCGDGWRVHNPKSDPMLWLNGRIFTYGPDPNWHRAVFDERHLGRCLKEAGFVSVSRIAERQRGLSHGAIDLGMVGVKP